MNNLYPVPEKYLSLLDQFLDDEAQTGLDQGDMQVFKQLDSFNDDIQEKAINLAAYIKNLKIEQAQVKQARKQMQERETKLKNKIDWLERGLIRDLHMWDIKKITKSPYFIITLRQCPVSLYITNERLIPEDYKETKEIISINNAKLKKDLEDGLFIEGAELQRNVSLVIK